MPRPVSPVQNLSIPEFEIYGEGREEVGSGRVTTLILGTVGEQTSAHGPQDQASPFMEGAAVYVDLAMTWGVTHGVGVLLDLQAAPGSQNGCAVTSTREKTVRSVMLARAPTHCRPDCAYCSAVSVGLLHWVPVRVVRLLGEPCCVDMSAMTRHRAAGERYTQPARQLTSRSISEAEWAHPMALERVPGGQGGGRKHRRRLLHSGC